MNTSKEKMRLVGTGHGQGWRCSIMAYPQEAQYTIDCECKGCGIAITINRVVEGRHQTSEVVHPIFFCNDKCFELYMTCPEITNV